MALPPGNAVTTSRTRRSKMSGGSFENGAVNAIRGDSDRHRRGVMIGISSDPRRIRLACGVPVLACSGDEGCRALVDRLDAGQQNAGIRTARGQLDRDARFVEDGLEAPMARMVLPWRYWLVTNSSVCPYPASSPTPVASVGQDERVEQYRR